MVHIFDNDNQIADYIGKLLIDIGNHTKELRICLSGGNTPRSIYSLLAKNKESDIPWEKMEFFWGDERCVPPGDHQSNYRMAMESFLGPLNIEMDVIHRIKGENDPDFERLRYAEIVKSNTNGVFDLFFLGLGNDGHIASIFPNQMFNLNSRAICEKVIHPDTGQIRITLTGNIINASKNVVFLVTGSGKSDIVREVIQRTGEWNKYPASHIQPKEGKLIWLLDKNAAALL